MKLIKALFFTLLFVLTMIVAVQNADIFLSVMTFEFDWPEVVSLIIGLPLFAIIFLIFLAGFVFTSLIYFGEYFGLRSSLTGVQKKCKILEDELRPEPEPLRKSSDLVAPELESTADEAPVDSKRKVEPSRHVDRQIVEHQVDVSSSDQKAIAADMDSSITSQTLQIPSESTMETPTSAAPQEQKSTASRNVSETDFDQEILVRQSGPGWAALILLSAALALVVSSAVYIVLNEQISQFSEQLSELHIQSGHMASAQEEMGLAWEQEKTVLREEIGALSQEQTTIVQSVENLEGQMESLQALPEEVRKQVVAGFLRDAAGKTAFIGTQVETDHQRETLERAQEMLNSLADELEGNN